MSTSIRKRARQPEQKIERRGAILAAAFDLWRMKGFQHLTMNDLARQVGLAKGTLYLYFATKDELFLAMLELRFSAWLNRLCQALSGCRKNDPESVSTVFVETLQLEPDVLPLLLLLEPVLEHNVDHQSVINFKKRMLTAMAPIAIAVESCLPSLTGRGTEILLRMRAYMTGIQQIISSPPSVMAAIAIDSDLKALGVEPARELHAGFLALLQSGRPAVLVPPSTSVLTPGDPTKIKQPSVTEHHPWQRRF